MIQVSLNFDVSSLRLLQVLYAINFDVSRHQEVVLDHIVGDSQCNHRILHRVKLVNVDDAKQDELSFECYFNLERALLQI